MFGREVRFPYEITVHSSPKAWGFRVLEGPIRLSAILSFTTERDGTRVESELHVPGALGHLLGPLMLSQQRGNYARLKALLEEGRL
jgi:hypothetical protein